MPFNAKQRAVASGTSTPTASTGRRSGTPGSSRQGSTFGEQILTVKREQAHERLYAAAKPRALPDTPSILKTYYGMDVARTAGTCRDLTVHDRLSRAASAERRHADSPVVKRAAAPTERPRRMPTATALREARSGGAHGARQTTPTRVPLVPRLQLPGSSEAPKRRSEPGLQKPRLETKTAVPPEPPGRQAAIDGAVGALADWSSGTVALTSGREDDAAGVGSERSAQAADSSRRPAGMPAASAEVAAELRYAHTATSDRRFVDAKVARPPTHTHTHTRTHSRTHARTHAHSHSHTHSHAHTRTHTRTHAQEHDAAVGLVWSHAASTLECRVRMSSSIAYEIGHRRAHSRRPHRQ
jgi:hypothetical protein